MLYAQFFGVACGGSLVWVLMRLMKKKTAKKSTAKKSTAKKSTKKKTSAKKTISTLRKKATSVRGKIARGAKTTAKVLATASDLLEAGSGVAETVSATAAGKKTSQRKKR
jgi:DNA-binding protein HU-beta